MKRAIALVLSALSAMSMASACSGPKFSGGDATAGGHAGRSDSTSAGMDSAAGASGTPQGGQAGSGASSSDAGETSSGMAGESSIAGAAGAGGAPDCAALGGHDFAAHCYVDVTTTSVAYAEAVAACVALASHAGRTGQLLVLDSPEEQTFVLTQFLSELTDAWLGLTCNAIRHPEFTSCYCTNCDASQRIEKRALWAWLNGATTTFGWAGQNPDGGGRCSALAYNPASSIWGWVDRDCSKTTHQLTGYPVHDYRTICELE